jgi:phasin family protein
MAKQGFNPFDPAEMMKLFDPMQVMNQLQRNMERYTAGGFQLTDLMQNQRKNLEALMEANRILFTSTQQLLQRQNELLNQAGQEAAAAASALAAGSDLKELPQRQVQMLTEHYNRSVTTLQEATDMIIKAQQDAMQVLDQRWQEHIQELQKLQKTTSGGGSS